MIDEQHLKPPQCFGFDQKMTLGLSSLVHLGSLLAYRDLVVNILCCLYLSHGMETAVKFRGPVPFRWAYPSQG